MNMDLYLHVQQEEEVQQCMQYSHHLFRPLNDGLSVLIYIMQGGILIIDDELNDLWKRLLISIIDRRI
jgi:hypothetical protein